VDPLWDHPTPARLGAALLGPTRDLVARATEGILDRGATVQRCDLHRAKFKPGRKLSTYYDMHLRGAGGEDLGVRSVAATWVPPGRDTPPAPTVEELAQQDAAFQAGLAGPFTALATALPEHGLRVQVFPLDPKFPQLVRVADPRHVRAMLNGSETAGYAVTPIRYRPGQRHVLRYDATAGTVYAKTYNDPDKAARIFTAIGQVADWLDTSAPGTAALRPLAYVAPDQTLLYPHLAGTPLTERLQQPGPQTSALIRTAGETLRVLHHLPPGRVTLRPHSFDKEMAGITTASEHIDTLLPPVGARIHSILEHARLVHDKLEQEPSGFAYGDYKADHLWVTPAGLHLMDFDTCYLSDQAIDLGKFLADLRWWHDRHGTGDEQLAGDFLEGYGEASEARVRRARLYEVLVLVKSTARRVRLFEPDWAQRTERLIALADSLLAPML
jgi:aminoglycoside phosphotransferase (APT) family kinase protein